MSDDKNYLFSREGTVRFGWDSTILAKNALAVGFLLENHFVLSRFNQFSLRNGRLVTFIFTPLRPHGADLERIWVRFERNS